MPDIKRLNAVDKVRQKLSELDSELYALSSLYNLHFIQTKNIYINSILEAYKKTNKDDYNIASILGENQVLLYNTRKKKSLVVNLSLKIYGSIWKIFIRDIEKLSIINSANEFYRKFKSRDFMQVIVIKATSNIIYFKAKDSTSFQNKKITFSYKTRSLEERHFLLENDKIWIHSSSVFVWMILLNTSISCVNLLSLNRFSSSKL